VLGRFSSGLPRRFRGGLIRGFLRESLLLPEVCDVAGKLIPQLISDNVTKRPRNIANLTQTTSLTSSAVRACLRLLGESDRAIVRPLDKQQETWEIAHDFLVPLLDSIVARRTVSFWRRFRPWLPWTAAVTMGIAVIAITLITSRNPRTTLINQGWAVSQNQGILLLQRDSPIPSESVSILRDLPPPFSLDLSHTNVTDVSTLKELKNLTQLNLVSTHVNDIWALKDLKNLTYVSLSSSPVTDVSAMKDLRNLTHLDLSHTPVRGGVVLKDLKNLTYLNLRNTNVSYQR
jgi:hypothetical protein